MLTPEPAGGGDPGALRDGLAAGDRRAQDRLLAQHYQEVRRIACRILKGDGDRLHIQPTDLAHEAVIRVLKLDRVAIKDRAHFLALSARVMRQVLLDEVRQAHAAKRTPPVATTWDGPDGARETSRLDLDAFDEALGRLAAVAPERARVVELRFRTGMTLEEVAVQMGASLSTVKRRWRTARAWLLDELGLDRTD